MYGAPGGAASPPPVASDTMPASSVQYAGTSASVAIRIARHLRRGDSGSAPASGDRRVRPATLTP
jgi:hypothetical protein